MLSSQAIFLGIVQGITEFLPISSSGHLVILQKILGFKEPPIAFDALVHFGTVIALLIFFRKEIKKIFINLTKEIREKKKGEGLSLLFFLILGTVPIVILGIFLKDKIEEIFNSLFLVGISFLITSLMLFLTSIIKKKQKSIKQITLKDALFIGIFQAIAILPGVSRSGSTISAGLFRGVKKEDAFNFSFYLGIIAIFGATILQTPKLFNFTETEILSSVLGFISALIFGFIALKILKPIVIKGKFHYFGIYCFILGLTCLVFSLI